MCGQRHRFAALVVSGCQTITMPASLSFQEEAFVGLRRAIIRLPDLTQGRWQRTSPSKELYHGYNGLTVEGIDNNATKILGDCWLHKHKGSKRNYYSSISVFCDFPVRYDTQDESN